MVKFFKKLCTGYCEFPPPRHYICPLENELKYFKMETNSTNSMNSCNLRGGV